MAQPQWLKLVDSDIYREMLNSFKNLIHKHCCTRYLVWIIPWTRRFKFVQIKSQVSQIDMR